MKYSFLIVTLALCSLSLALPLTLNAASPSPAVTTQLTASPRPVASPKLVTLPQPLVSPKLVASPLPIRPSPSPAMVQTDQTTKNLKDRIEKIVEEKRDQIEGVLDDISGRKRGYIGEVQRVTAESITLKTKRGAQILSLQDEIMITKGGQRMSGDEIAVGDWAIVIGSMKDDELVPERLVISSVSLRPADQVLTLGTVNAVTKTTIKVTPKSGTEAKTFTFTKTTKYQDMNGDDLRITSVTVDQPVLVIGQTTKENVLEAKIIRILAPIASPKTNVR